MYENNVLECKLNTCCNTKRFFLMDTKR